ncbi:hypothetical protein FYK55_28565 [Roseiconus nitratireducens]|uniref:Uncharacterized protein n=1 Tax=Roseiconus nitratireducens TaxID=2605748 RepID=A0A5M6CN48_9BACT|nr:hypothetical protein [Roseiconus nitratireducens]KAA5535412.1 hypothetical protein FYK55_28565 [Roseiconus nitratireducens]
MLSFLNSFQIANPVTVPVASHDAPPPRTRRGRPSKTLIQIAMEDVRIDYYEFDPDDFQTGHRLFFKSGRIITGPTANYVHNVYHFDGIGF